MSLIWENEFFFYSGQVFCIIQVREKGGLMKKKEMIWLRIVVLPVSLFVLVVALDQRQSWLVVLSILMILSIIAWWYFDEIKNARMREEKQRHYQEFLTSMGVKSIRLSLIEDTLREDLLMEKIYRFTSCKVSASLHGFYQGVEFSYFSLSCKGDKTFIGHMLRLQVPGSKEERVGVYEAFPYDKKIKGKTVVGRSSEYLEVCVEGLDYLSFERTEDMKLGLGALLEEIEQILEGEDEVT